MPGLETNVDDEIAGLVAMREAGSISWAEFDRRKAALLVQPERPEPRRSASAPPRWLVIGVVVVAVVVVLVIVTR